MSQPLDNFSQGLLALNLNPFTVKETWKYAGGSSGSHARYLDMLDISIKPEYTKECVCGHHIVENCYICDPTETNVLTVGNCCIKRFILKSTRTCSKCDAPHQNRSNNLCGSCREFQWCPEPKCKRMRSKFSKYCEVCVNKHPNQCKTCQKPCKTFHYCFLCNKKRSANAPATKKPYTQNEGCYFKAIK